MSENKRLLTKDELLKELKNERVDGFYVRNNYSDYDQWVNLEDINDIFSEVEIVKERSNEL